MWVNILGHAFWQLAVLLYLLFAGAGEKHMYDENEDKCLMLKGECPTGTVLEGKCGGLLGTFFPQRSATCHTKSLSCTVLTTRLQTTL